MKLWLSIDFDFFAKEDPAWDWGHAESALFRSTSMWTIRASDLLARGIDLRKEITIDKSSFPHPQDLISDLKKMNIKFDDPIIAVADSHRFAHSFFSSKFIPRANKILHIDAHHDLGYDVTAVMSNSKTKKVDCGDWQFHTLVEKKNKKINTSIVYPTWKSDSEWQLSWGKELAKHPELSIFFKDRVDINVWPNVPIEGTVVAIFICKSSSWTPPWFDKEFKRFVETVELHTNGSNVVDFVEHEKFDPLEVRQFSWDNVEKQANAYIEMEKLVFGK